MPTPFSQKAKELRLSYPEYYDHVTDLVANGTTSGHEQSASLIGYTSLNLKRMTRLDKTFRISEALAQDLEAMQEKQHWWVITEAWCGDSAQNLSTIAGIAQASKGKIELTIVFRDDNPELMDAYLTNGSRSIPKLVAFNENGEELFTWGPRPAAARELLLQWKKDPQGRSWEDFEMELHTWYAKDKTKSLQGEFHELFSKLVEAL